MTARAAHPAKLLRPRCDSLSCHLVFREQHVGNSFAALGGRGVPRASARAICRARRAQRSRHTAHLMVNRCPDSGHTRTPSSMCT
jgi:hypothetical protein